jgi:hypothetical protein
MSLIRVSMPSPNYSSRSGSARILVLHTAEGARTIESLGNFFANSANEVSSHAGADDKVNTVGIYVQRPNKAWTQANYNDAAVAIELCGFAEWTRAQWENEHGNMLANTAAWLAEESAALGIPLVKLSASQAQGGGRGVCQHIDLGSGGGGHVDCDFGTGNFPIDKVLSMATGGAPIAPSPPTPSAPAGPAPPLHVDYFGIDHNSTHPDVGVWQAQMSARGWSIGVDSVFGPQSEDVCRSFQSEKGLAADGLVGPDTWSASWTAPVT